MYVLQCDEKPKFLPIIKQLYQLGFIATSYRKQKIISYTVIGIVRL